MKSKTAMSKSASEPTRKLGERPNGRKNYRSVSLANNGFVVPHSLCWKAERDALFGCTVLVQLQKYSLNPRPGITLSYQNAKANLFDA